jgi:hypothetical protein
MSAPAQSDPEEVFVDEEDDMEAFTARTDQPDKKEKEPPFLYNEDSHTLSLSFIDRHLDSSQHHHTEEDDQGTELPPGHSSGLQGSKFSTRDPSSLFKNIAGGSWKSKIGSKDVESDVSGTELQAPAPANQQDKRVPSSVFAGVHIDRTESRLEVETMIDNTRKSTRLALNSPDSLALAHNPKDVYVGEDDDDEAEEGGGLRKLSDNDEVRQGTVIGGARPSEGRLPPPPPPGSPRNVSLDTNSEVEIQVELESDDEFPTSSSASGDPLASFQSRPIPGPPPSDVFAKPTLPAHRRMSHDVTPTSNVRRTSREVLPEMRRHSHDVTAEGPLSKKPSLFKLPSFNKQSSKEDTLGDLRSPMNSDRMGRKESVVMMLKRTASVIKNVGNSNLTEKQTKPPKETKLRKEMTSFFKEENPNAISMKDLEKKLGIKVCFLICFFNYQILG